MGGGVIFCTIKSKRQFKERRAFRVIIIYYTTYFNFGFKIALKNNFKYFFFFFAQRGGSEIDLEMSVNTSLS